MCVHARVCVRVRMCARACVRACVCACVCARVRARVHTPHYPNTGHIYISIKQEEWEHPIRSSLFSFFFSSANAV